MTPSDFDLALCREYSIELWFPPAFDENPTGTDSEYYEVGKMVCAFCPHITECKEVGAEEKFGVWGGTTPAERRKGSSRQPKRSLTYDAFKLLPKSGERVEVGDLRKQLREVTYKS